MFDLSLSRCRIRLFYFTSGLFAMFFMSMESFVIPQSANHDFATWEKTPCKLMVVEPYAWGNPQDFLFIPHVVYSYSMDGQSYTGKLFSWSDSQKPLSKQKILALLAPYKVGEMANCYVNPAEPGRAYLLRPHAEGTFPLWVGALGILIMMMLLGLLLQELLRKPLPM
ncbi:DUF3592 domain-containing protein [Kiritimatiellota bacterium B12222]|nr:DUF3592 domain-containing protein [Kiritimatiellota bacterium B12222]